MQPCSAFADSHPRPLSSQSLAGGLYRIIDQPLICFCDLRDHAAVRRVHIGEIPLPTHELPVDVILDELQFGESPAAS